MSSDLTHTHIAFLGLGIMGSGMARRLLEAGARLSVFNRSADRDARDHPGSGARVAAAPRDAVAYA